MIEPDTTFDQPKQRPSLRVPDDDGTFVAAPELAEAVRLIEANHTALAAEPIDLQGRTLGALRQWARQEVYQAARDYTAWLRGTEVTGSPEPPQSLAVAGHQPALFHPGVWVKNFAIGALAEATDGAAVNLVVDNDLLSSTRLWVPVGSRDYPDIEPVAFDADRPREPWEEAAVEDSALFGSFADRVAERIGRWGIDPLLSDIWPDAVAFAEESARLGDCLTAARHRLEHRAGLSNLELPMRQLCTLEPFLWFFGHLLAHLPRFQEVHNAAVNDHRRVNKIRSRMHPVPNLKARDGWFEAPFWVWRQGDPRRGRVFAKQVGREVWLADGGETFARLPLTPDSDACCAVEVLRELPERGIRLRTRALTTTLFARLAFADLFVHGIGGAKYDEITDRIISRFFHLSPPDFLTLSATAFLPLAEPFNVRPADATRLRVLLRDLDYNSDRHITPGTDRQADQLITEKRHLIAEQHRAEAVGGLSKSQRRQRRRTNHDRFRRFRDVDARLAQHSVFIRRRVEAELEAVREQLAANTVLKNREFSFALYPWQKLLPLMETLRNRL